MAKILRLNPEEGFLDPSSKNAHEIRSFTIKHYLGLYYRLRVVGGVG